MKRSTAYRLIIMWLFAVLAIVPAIALAPHHNSLAQSVSAFTITTGIIGFLVFLFWAIDGAS